MVELKRAASLRNLIRALVVTQEISLGAVVPSVNSILPIYAVHNKQGRTARKSDEVMSRTV